MSRRHNTTAAHARAVDAALLELYGIRVPDTGLEPADFLAAKEAGLDAEALVRWIGEKYDLDLLGNARRPYLRR